MSIIVGTARLNSKAYHYFHALHFKDEVILESKIDSIAIRELVGYGLVEPTGYEPGTVLNYTAKGRVMSYLFYVNGALRTKELTKLCEWRDNEVLIETLTRSTYPTKKDEIREYTTFLWWLNKIKAGVALSLFTLEEVNACLDLTLENTELDKLTLTLPNTERKLVV